MNSQIRRQVTSAVLALLWMGTVLACWSPAAEDKAKDPPKFTKTKSGLKYRILRESKGKKPAASDTVTVHYRGWLDSKQEFDSSYKRKMPATFPLNRVIAGWTEGVQLVGVGSKIELEIPSELGYGKRGAGNVVPPNATLHFVIELISIK